MSIVSIYVSLVLLQLVLQKNYIYDFIYKPFAMQVIEGYNCKIISQNVLFWQRY